MSMKLAIRDEFDADAIRAVLLRTFPTDAEAQLVDQLRADGNLTVSLVAAIEGEVIGHVALSPVTVDGARAGLGLAPVAVTPAHQRAGIGSELVRRALATCRDEQVALVVVLGDPSFYSRFGFVPASEYGLRDAYGGGASFQAIRLSARKALRPGLVEYAPAFGVFG